MPYSNETLRNQKQNTQKKNLKIQWKSLRRLAKNRFRKSNKNAQISVIVPTLWLPGGKFVCRLLRRLSNYPTVGEIILIDNNTASTPAEISRIPKLKYLPQSENKYVNPSWNLGASEARFEIIAFCNDDIIPPPKAFSAVLKAINSNTSLPIGIIGTREDCYIGKRPTKKSEATIHITAKREYGFGSLMFMRRADFSPIPNLIRINCGDDWLFEEQRRKGGLNLAIGNIFIKQKSRRHSISSKRKEFNSIRIGDLENYHFIKTHFRELGGPAFNSELLKLIREIKTEINEIKTQHKP